MRWDKNCDDNFFGAVGRSGNKKNYNFLILKGLTQFMYFKVLNHNI
jgi:hypothetical protein